MGRGHYCVPDGDFHNVDAKRVKACKVESRKVKADEVDAGKIKVQELELSGPVEAEHLSVKTINVSETLTIPSTGLIWSDVAQVTTTTTSPVPSSTDVVPAEEPRETETSMQLDFMIPVASPLVQGLRMRVGVPEPPVVDEGPVVASRMTGNNSSGTDTDDDVVVEKCARIKKCLLVKRDATIRGDLYVEGHIFAKCPAEPEGDCDCDDGVIVPEGYCRVKCKCHHHDDCCDDEEDWEDDHCCGGHAEIQVLKNRLAALEALVASHHA